MLVGGIGSTLKRAGIDVVTEAGEILRRDAEGFVVRAGDGEYVGRQSCSSAQALPQSVPPIPGLREAVAERLRD